MADPSVTMEPIEWDLLLSSIGHLVQMADVRYKTPHSYMGIGLREIMEAIRVQLFAQGYGTPEFDEWCRVFGFVL